jgi:hypothetical protein
MVYAKEQIPGDELPQWLRSSGAYFLHVVLACIGVFLISIFLGAGVGWLNEKLADAIFTESFYPGVIVVGLLVGYAANKFLQSKFVLWFWILPAILILWDFYDFRHIYGWRGTFNYLFLRKNCDDCVESLLMVAPFYGSIAYSLGAWAALKLNSRRAART